MVSFDAIGCDYLCSCDLCGFGVGVLEGCDHFLWSGTAMVGKLSRNLSSKFSELCASYPRPSE